MVSYKDEVRRVINTDSLVEAYAAGESASALARRCGVSVWKILNDLRKCGVQIRSIKEQNERHRGTPRTEAFTFRDLIDGLLLGDGYIDKKGLLHLEQTSVRLGWVEQVQHLLHEVGADSKIIPVQPRTKVYKGREIRGNGGNVLYTPAYVELQAERARWYPQGLKVVPRDLRLTPICVAQWFWGDGSYSPDGTLILYTNGFTPEDVDFLATRIEEDLGVEAHAARTNRPNQHSIKVSRRDEAVKFSDLIKPWMPPCMEYKLQHVRASQAGKHMRKLTEGQVRSARLRHIAGESYDEIAEDCGVSRNAIVALVKGKNYAWVS